MHIDHYEVAMAAMVALRPVNNPQLKAIYAYETLSETEWSIPNAENAFMQMFGMILQIHLQARWRQ